MANAEFETKWAAAPTSTSPNGATLPRCCCLIAGVATQVLPDNLSVGKIKTGTPASAAATGVAGQIRWDAAFVYICVARYVWKRVAIATW
jgi:hypothetical protein